MTEEVGKKVFKFQSKSELDISEIKDWLDSVEEPGEGSLTLVLKKQTDERQKRQDIATSLRILLAENTNFVWKYQNYYFDFNTKRYRKDEEFIYLTPGEELFVYRWLVLKEKFKSKDKYYLYNLRLKFGRDFLKDIEMPVDTILPDEYTEEDEDELPTAQDIKDRNRFTEELDDDQF